MTMNDKAPWGNNPCATLPQEALDALKAAGIEQDHVYATVCQPYGRIVVKLTSSAGELLLNSDHREGFGQITYCQDSASGALTVCALHKTLHLKLMAHLYGAVADNYIRKLQDRTQ